MKLSDNFYLSEFTFSETASRMGREIVPNDEVIGNLQRLCLVVLEPLREALGDRVIVVSSGYRPVWLNSAVGGSATSAHIDGRAADIRVVGMSPAAVADALKASIIPYDQCILEFDRWVHVGIEPFGQQPRRQALVARSINGRTEYGVMP